MPTLAVAMLAALASLNFRAVRAQSTDATACVEQGDQSGVYRCGNAGAALPARFADDTSQIDYTDNALTELPEAIFRDLSALVDLSVRDNQITAVHGDQFQGCRALVRLSLAGNRIASIPGGKSSPAPNSPNPNLPQFPNSLMRALGV